MRDNIDAFVEKLQEQIFTETRQAFDEAGFQRWRNPLYRGPLDKADAHARLTGTCGDTMEIFLKFENDRVASANWVGPPGKHWHGKYTSPQTMSSLRSTTGCKTMAMPIT